MPDRVIDHEPERYELTEPPAHVFRLARRHFLQASGGALVVAALVTESPGQAGRGAGTAHGDSSDVAAWLRIDADGRVTVFTGKVEVGQNARTSLAQAVADELHVPVHTVSLVMGDTDLTPFDNGTYGSQTTPRMAPQLARAARAARRLLLQRAGELWTIDPSRLSAAEGRVESPDGRSVGYGDLVRGRQLHGAVADAPSPHSEWRVRGTPRAKVNARTFVTGEHRYTVDIERPGMWYGRVIRPSHYGATAGAVDVSAARRLGDAIVVHDGDFIGVAAASPRAAARAAAAIRVSWQVPAGQPSSESLYDVLRPGGAAGTGTPQIIGQGADGMRLAARRLARTFRIPYIAHVPLEPRAAVAEWDEAGKLTVWTGTQRPFGVRQELARAFHIPEERVRVLVPDTGSAYGGKHTGEQAIEAARLARAARRPVRLTWSRAEEFMWAYFRPAGVIEVAAGIDEKGRLVAWTFDNWNSGTAAIRPPYDIPHQALTFHRVESPLRQGSYRALAATANTYAREMLIDQVAREVGVDPLAYRLEHLSDARMRDVLEAVARVVGWPPTTGSDRAWGIACGTEKGSVVATAAEVSRDPVDGFRVERLVTAFECGAIVNPDGLRHQVEGAIVQGLGGALFEAVRFAGGRLLNGSLSQYRVPRFADVPTIDVLLVDRPDRPSAGAGETPIVSVAPAIGSAARAFGVVEDALPVRLAASA
jgi:nicotinate dehydrogenase subunit B